MKNILIVIVILFSIRCSKPFQFDVRSSTLDVIDAKISTLSERSFVRIYRVLNEEERIPISDLDVKVITGDGEEFDFIYDDVDRYLPISPFFVGEIGQEYKMMAFKSNRLMYESSFDAIPAPIEFTIKAKDTLILRLSSQNIIVDEKAVVAVAEIGAQESQSYGRINFGYSYLDFFSNEKTEVETDQYALYACEVNAGCSENIKVPIGYTFKDEWRFVDQTVFCELARDTTDFGMICILPCCQFLENWPTEFYANLESMSFATYKYWKDANSLLNNDGLVFDTFPFPVSGNITCNSCESDVVGLFRAVSETIATTPRTL
ncbi:DUF4249 family protein [Ekhidna sp.]